MNIRTSLASACAYSLLALGLGLHLSACDSVPAFGDEGGGGDSGLGGGSSSTGGRSNLTPGIGQGGAGGATSGGNTVEIIDELPEGFTAADAHGGWKVVGALEDVTIPEDEGCANILNVVVRDFAQEHPDMQNSGDAGLALGIARDALDDETKPILSSNPPNNSRVTSAESFAQWYRNVEQYNAPHLMELWLEPVGDTFIFDSSAFFPMDGFGFDEKNEDNNSIERNFHFTTELHTRFEYKGGEEFTFRGDDDVWVYINGKLAIDLGGVHGAEEGSVVLDDAAEQLGISPGNVYTFDLFQAERQTVQSNFRIETTLDFTECGVVLPGDIIK